jgi:hypothetical protein
VEQNGQVSQWEGEDNKEIHRKYCNPMLLDQKMLSGEISRQDEYEPGKETEKEQKRPTARGMRRTGYFQQLQEV